MSIAIIGTTTSGTTLGILLANKGLEVRLWARTEKEAEEINNRRENPYALPGFTFPLRLSATNSIERALKGARLIILAVPAQTMRGNIRTIKDYITRDMFILSVAKGLEVDTGKRMSEVIADEIPHISPNICVLSGPNLAKEIVRGLPAASVIAGKRKAANKVKGILNSPHLHLEISDDVIGVELGGALKNIIALGAGIVEGLGYGDNAKAAFITHGLEEMVALGRALGAKPVTFFGLTGLGDLIVTCFSPLSRNHYVGLELAKGRSIKEITASMRDVAEGVTTVMAAKKLAQRLSVDMPIVERVYEILFEGLSPHEVVKGILSPHILAQR